MFRTITITSILLLPLFAFAHTSDERYVDGMVVDLSTAPVAPWVGEKVGFLFSFLDPNTFTVLDTIKSSQISITATFRENGKPQEEIYVGPTESVARGTVNFDYVFTEEGTYDVHITFVTTDGKEHLAGYRRQIRTGMSEDTHGWGQDALLVFIGLISGTLFTNYLMRKKLITQV